MSSARMNHFDQWLADDTGRCFMRKWKPDEDKLYFPKICYRTWESMIGTDVKLEDPVLNVFKVTMSSDLNGMNGGNSDTDSKHLWKSEISAASLVKSQPLGVPASIAKDYLKKNQEFLPVMLSDGSTEDWQLIWNKYRKNQVHLGSGWYNFSKENDLKVGDKFIFWENVGQHGVVMTIDRC
ncbi:DNA-binding barrel domain superfamily [Sesbania bispinosa]|nr:DNA-binding barrel domain superfamily [Sesbania bispinosa]